MASSQQKAVALKDAYVKGIVDSQLGSETAGSFSDLPEKDMGNTAGRVYDLQNGVVYQKNDHNDRMVIRDGSRRAVIKVHGGGMPLDGKGYGAMKVNRMTQNELNGFGSLLHKTSNNIDNSVWTDFPRNRADIDRAYSEQMIHNYTHQ